MKFSHRTAIRFRDICHNFTVKNYFKVYIKFVIINGLNYCVELHDLINIGGTAVEEPGSNYKRANFLQRKDPWLPGMLE